MTKPRPVDTERALIRQRMRSSVGLWGLAACVAACGPSRPPDESDAGGDSTADDTSDGTDADDGGDGGERTCTVQRYDSHPDRSEYMEEGCMPARPDGTCDECDAACMDAILPSCPFDGCGLPDVGCWDDCAGMQVLCSEVVGDQCCHVVTGHYSGPIPGRPLRVAGVPALPELKVEAGTGRTGVRTALRFREAARYEHASVDAFVACAEFLASMGAPNDLVAAHRVAAEQEATHCALALGAARELDGADAEVYETRRERRPFDSPEVFIEHLIDDGCVGELVAVHEANCELRSGGGGPSARHYWSTVRTDELEHAALAWTALEFVLERRPDLRTLATERLRRAIEGLSGTTHPHVAAAAEDLRWLASVA